MRTRVAVGIWTLALLIAVGVAAMIATSDHQTDRLATGIFATAVSLSFIGTGLIAWQRRPENRIGLLMTLVGFSWFLAALRASDYSLPFTLGFALGDLVFAFFAWLILAFPNGRLESRVSKIIVATAFAITTVGRLIWVLVNDLRDDAPDGPANAFLIARNDALAAAVETAVLLIALVLIVSVFVIFVRRWRAASPPLRRSLAPVLLTSALAIVALGTYVTLDLLAAPGQQAAWWVTLAALVSVPVSFLFGVLQSRLARAGVGQLLVELGRTSAPGDLRDALRRALNDPTLEIAYWIPDSETFVDVTGKPLPPPSETGTRWATMVERNGERVAAIVHDESLRADPELVDAVAAAAGLALENERRLAALAESEARNRALLDALPDLMFRMRRDGTYLDYKGNPADLAAPPDQLIGSNVYDILPRDAAERIMRSANRILDLGAGVATIEYQLRIGSLNRQFEGRIVPSSADEVLLIVRDISERKRAEAQLQRLQDELRARFADLERERDFIRAVVDAAPCFFCLVDPDSRIARFNRTLELASGIKDDETVRGRQFCEVFIVPEERHELVEEMKELFALRSSAERESHWVSASGEPLLVAWSATPILDEYGEQRYLITGVDITHRKRHEEEIRASRARIVEAGDVERRRLERNLHDGAQQRLVALSISLRLADAKLESDPEGARKILADASDQLAHALEELRELARGIHPAVLTDRGLEPALHSLVAQAPVPVTIAEAPDDRLPEPVEAAAYYVVSEALANISKYADASAATVRVSRQNGRAIVEVADDGVGGADPQRGSGLRGLADRVEALDGRLEVESPPGRGTTIRAEIPVADA